MSHSSNATHLVKQATTRDKVLGHAIQHGDRIVLGASELVHHLLLNTDTKIVTVLDAWDVELDPDLDRVEHLDLLQQLLLERVHHGHDTLHTHIQTNQSLSH